MTIVAVISKLRAYKQAGHNDAEEYQCLDCRKIFCWKACNTPEVQKISDRIDGKTKKMHNEIKGACSWAWNTGFAIIQVATIGRENDNAIRTLKADENRQPRVFWPQFDPSTTLPSLV